MTEHNLANSGPARSPKRYSFERWIFLLAAVALLVLVENSWSAPVSGRSAGFGMLLIPMLGLFAICRDGRWRWRVIDDNVFNALFWIGWFTGLTCGILKLCGV